MGVAFKVDGRTVRPVSYRVSEGSMPLAGGDSSGSIGTINVDLVDLPYHPIGLNVEESLEVIDTSRGSTLGKIREVSSSRTDGARYSLMANTRLGEFNIEAQVQPFVGNLGDAFRYYCSVANIDTGISVHPTLASRPVSFPGWSGNLWNYMKQMATGVGADLNLISNVVVLRPVRLFEAIQRREIDSDATVSGLDLALKQEVIWYETAYQLRGLVYPSGGYRPDITPLSVNAGEVAETVLDTSKDVNSSIFSLEQPVPMARVAPDYTATSVYTIIGEDNIEIPPALWTAYGGSLTVAVGADTRSIVVTLTGASGLFQKNGDPIRTFRIALSSDGSSNSTYSTLRIVGRHVRVNQRSLILPTGVESYRTAQEFAPTIDNPFLNNLNSAYAAGIKGARRYAGRTASVNATLASINKRGVTGTANYPPYSAVQAQIAPRTYGQDRIDKGGAEYSTVQAQLYASVQDDFDNQIFGNAPGARFYDRETGRWYRVRESTVEWGNISVTADDDLLNSDMQAHFNGRTYAQVKSAYGGRSYYKANLTGLLVPNS